MRIPINYTLHFLRNPVNDITNSETFCHFHLRVLVTIFDICIPIAIDFFDSLSHYSRPLLLMRAVQFSNVLLLRELEIAIRLLFTKAIT